MADSAVYVQPVANDWDPNNPYTGDYTPPPDPYAGIGDTGGYAITPAAYAAWNPAPSNPAGPVADQSRGYQTPRYSNSPTFQPAVDPYQTGLQGLEGDVNNQTSSFMDAWNPYVTAADQNYTQGVTARQGILDQQNGALGQFATADSSIYGDLANTNAGLAQAGNGAIGWEAGQFGQSEGMDAGNVSGLGTSLSNANYLDTQNMGQLSSSLGQANAMDAANYGTLSGQAAGMQQLVAGGYGADVTSNPEDVARQESAYGTLGDFASGAYDYTSQAATAQADATALADQKDALSQLQSQTKPQLTDAERYLYMQSRLQEEQSNRANRDANMRELERSGMSGSTMELSNLNASSQQTATTRAEADLGANAKAIDRASAALRDYGNLSSTVVGQSFQQDYARGQAADAASQFNTNTKLQGTIQQGNLATQMRTADDSLAEFNKAQSLQQQRFQDQYAADQQNAAWGRDVDVSNAGFQQSSNLARNASVLSNAGFQQSQDLSNNARTLSNAQFQQTQNINNNATSLTNSQLANIGQQGQRAGQQAQVGAQMNSDWLTGTQNVGQMGLNALNGNTQALGVASQNATTGLGILQTGASQRNALVAKGLDAQAEDARAQKASDAASAEADRARKAAADAADSTGIFGTPILSKNDPLSPFNWFRGKLGS